ncbi:unnamed protein product [Ilex paraguariensis]|uniref:Uncharacterized protein n=1 Tax=Ilex paraguariensis TaxID=185542 RepID=A0ABC8QSJ7_9AQUA
MAFPARTGNVFSSSSTKLKTIGKYQFYSLSPQPNLSLLDASLPFPTSSVVNSLLEGRSVHARKLPYQLDSGSDVNIEMEW